MASINRNMENIFKTAVDLSALAYREPEEIKQIVESAGLENFEWIENKDTDTQCFVCSNPDEVFVTVRGTSTWADWITNFKAEFVPFPYGVIHKGFWEDAQSIFTPVASALLKHFIKSRKIVFTGHSQGAGVTCPLALMFAPTIGIHAVIHFGGPRIVNRETAQKINKTLPGVFHRFVHNNDLVTRVVPRIAGGCHFGQLHYFKESGEYTQSISEWNAFLDRFSGKFTLGGEYVIDSFDDHDTQHYMRLVHDTWPGDSV